jgi:hypothetical protein
VLRVSALDDAALSSAGRRWLEISVRRTFSVSDPPLSGCCLLPNISDVGDLTKFVVISSWDNTIYRFTIIILVFRPFQCLFTFSYSVPNACVVGKRAAHDDGVSAVSCDVK